jgi:hypothetical protein
MDLKHRMAAIIIGLVGLSLQGLTGGVTIDAERSVEELKLMTTPELAGEARLICRLVVVDVESARKSYDLKFFDEVIRLYKEAHRRQQYLQRVGLVLRERNHGEMPAWFEQLSRAIDQSIPRKATDQPSPPDCDTLATAGGWRPKQ